MHRPPDYFSPHLSQHPMVSSSSSGGRGGGGGGRATLTLGTYDQNINTGRRYEYQQNGQQRRWQQGHADANSYSSMSIQKNPLSPNAREQQQQQQQQQQQNKNENYTPTYNPIASTTAEPQYQDCQLEGNTNSRSHSEYEVTPSHVSSNTSTRLTSNYSQEQERQKQKQKQKQKRSREEEKEHLKQKGGETEIEIETETETDIETKTDIEESTTRNLRESKHAHSSPMKRMKREDDTDDVMSMLILIQADPRNRRFRKKPRNVKIKPTCHGVNADMNMYTYLQTMKGAKLWIGKRGEIYSTLYAI